MTKPIMLNEKTTFSVSKPNVLRNKPSLLKERCNAWAMVSSYYLQLQHFTKKLTQSKMLAYNKLKSSYKFALILIITSGCMSIGSGYPKKSEKFCLLFKGDTVNITFFIDSSFEKIEHPIQWGCLECFNYKNKEFEVHFDFYEDQSVAVTHLADSVIINYIKKKYIVLAPKENLMSVEKISNDKLYGFLGQFDNTEGITHVFVGEFVTIHLSFSIEVYRTRIGKDKPETLNDIINSLEMRTLD